MTRNISSIRGDKKKASRYIKLMNQNPQSCIEALKKDGHFSVAVE